MSSPALFSYAAARQAAEASGEDWMKPVTPDQNTQAFTLWTLPHRLVYGYKHLDEGMQCHGHKFEIGKTYAHEGPVQLCGSGFHFCRHLEMLTSYKDVFQGSTHRVVARGPIGDPQDKEVSREITVVSGPLTFQEMMREANDGRYNLGFGNKGDQNRGDHNKGDQNRGDRNTGDQNTGHWNTGDQNRGHWNRGDHNKGDQNRGDHNTGDQNRGDDNTGDQNRGHWNRGDWNTGHWNTGDHNKGDHNRGDRNIGDENS